MKAELSLSFDKPDGLRGSVQQRLKRCDNALVFKGLTLREAYIKNILWIAIQYSPVVASVDELSALALISLKGNSKDAASCFRTRSVSEFEAFYVHSRSSRDQDNMLISDVQVMQPLEVQFPASVRLYFVDNHVDDAFAWRNSFSFMSIDGSYKRLPVPVKRETPIITPCGAIGFCGDVVSVVEGGPEVVNRIAQDGWDVFIERFGFQGPSLFQRAVLALGPQSLHVATDVIPKAGFKITDVMFGPFDF